MLLFNQFAMSQGGEWWCDISSQPEPFRYIRTGDFNSTYNPKLFALVHHIESRQIIFQDEFDLLRPLCYPKTVQQHFRAAGWQKFCKEHFLKVLKGKKIFLCFLKGCQPLPPQSVTRVLFVFSFCLHLTVMAQDVFLVCFAVNWLDSFEHVKAKWISEVHQPALYRFKYRYQQILSEVNQPAHKYQLLRTAQQVRLSVSQ